MKVNLKTEDLVKNSNQTQIKKHKIETVNFGWDRGSFHQFSFSKYDTQINEWSTHKGFPVKEYYDEYETYLNGDSVYRYTIITQTILGDSPMYNTTLEKLVDVIIQDWELIENDLPNCVKVIDELEVTLQYNNYGSTFLQWTFEGRKIKDVGKLYDVFMSVNLNEYPSVMELLYDYEVVNGNCELEGKNDRG